MLGTLVTIRRRRTIWLIAAAAAALIAASTGAAWASGQGAVGWGEDYYGDLGTNYKTSNEETPVAVAGGYEGLSRVIGGGAFGLALLPSGEAIGFGAGGHGQLGDHSYDDAYFDEKAYVPVEEEAEKSTYANLQGIAQLSAANEHSIALMSNGDVETWGNNNTGEMGLGSGGFEYETKQQTALPVIVPSLTPKALEDHGLPPAVEVLATGATDFARLENGEVMAWGRDVYGEAGVGPAHEEGGKIVESELCHTEVGWQRCITAPRLVVLNREGTPLMRAEALAGTQEAGYAVVKVKETGGEGYLQRVYAWGTNASGQLSAGKSATTGKTSRNSYPAPVLDAEGHALSGVVEISGGGAHVIALRENGEVVGWGASEEGQLGNAHTYECTAGEHSEEAERKHIEKGEPLPHPCVKAETRVVAAGTLGSGEEHEIAEISAGWKANILRTKGGLVYTWGSNSKHQLGISKGPEYSATPQQVTLPGQATQVSAESASMLVLMKEGTTVPAPKISTEAQKKAVLLKWTFPAERLTYHVGTLTERGEPEGTETPGGLEETGPPTVAQRPGISVPNPEETPEEGRRITAEKGRWNGERPLAYSYTWERCSAVGTECQALPRQHNSKGELRAENSYVPEAADVGHAMRVKVTVKNEFAVEGEEGKYKGEASETSEATEPVIEENLANHGESKKLTEAEREYLANQVKGEALYAEEPYEFHLTEAKTGVSREFRATPLR